MAGVNVRFDVPDGASMAGEKKNTFIQSNRSAVPP
jgi:hypothetical protein